MKKVTHVFGLVLIASVLFVIHTKYLYDIDPLRNIDLFKFGNLDLKKLIPYIMGAGFAITVSIIIGHIKKGDSKFWLFVFGVAALELIGVAIFFNNNLTREFFVSLSSFYYSLYVGFIVIMYAYIKPEESEKKQKEQAEKSEKREKNEYISKPDAIEKRHSTKASVQLEKKSRKQIRDEIYSLLDKDINTDPKEIQKAVGCNLATVYRNKNNYKNEKSSSL